MEQFITAIDFGTSKISIAVGENTAVGIKICAYSERDSEGIVRGDVLNITSSLNTLKELVRDVEGQMKNQTGNFKVRKVFAGISGTDVKCSKVTVRKERFDPDSTIDPREIDEMFTEAYRSSKSPDEEVIHVIPLTYSVDDVKDMPSIVGILGKHAQANYIIITSKTSATSNVRSVISRAGLELDKIVLNPVAAAKAVLQDDEEELGTAVVDLGCGTTDLTITKDRKVLYCAVIPFGSECITKDIIQECKVPKKQAERMKTSIGNCVAALAPENKQISIRDERGIISRRIPLRLLDQVIEARMKEIIATIIHHINESGNADNICKIVLTGGASHLSQVQMLFKSMTGYSCRIGIPKDSAVISLSNDEIFRSRCAAVAGIVLKGSEYELNESEKMEEEHSETDTNVINSGEEMEVTIEGNEGDKQVVREKGGKKPESPQGKKKIRGFFTSLFNEDNMEKSGVFDDEDNKA